MLFSTMKAIHLVAVVSLVSSCAVTPSGNSEAERYFVREVKPVLQQHCLRCHNGALPAPALNLTSSEKAFQTRPDGKAYIVAGKPDQSLLLTAIQRMGTHPKMMPRTDLSLTDDQIGMLREWIEDGAYWPAGKTGCLKPDITSENP